LVWDWGASALAVDAVSLGDVAESCEGFESSSYNHGSVGVGPINYCVVLFRSGRVKSDRESSVVVGSWW